VYNFQSKVVVVYCIETFTFRTRQVSFIFYAIPMTQKTDIEALHYLIKGEAQKVIRKPYGLESLIKQYLDGLIV
jgi:hypothetical protein